MIRSDDLERRDQSERVEGWKCIADMLGVHEQTAKGYADKYRAHRLPVLRNYRGRVWITVGALARWVREEEVPSGMRLEAWS